jgi:hypothetical protein
MPISCSAIKISGSSVLATAVLGSSVSVPACSGQSGHRSNFPLVGNLWCSRRIFSEIEAAELELSQTHEAPRGTLRVSLPLAGMLMMPTLVAFMRAYPEIVLDLDFSRRFEKWAIVPNISDSFVRSGGSRMDSLGSLNAFVQAAEARSFTLAGRQLGVSSSAIGKAVARMEERLGVRLLHRSTQHHANRGRCLIPRTLVHLFIDRDCTTESTITTHA